MIAKHPRTRPSRSGCNRGVSRAGSLSVRPHRITAASTRHSIKHLALLTMMLCLVGCGKWPPVVDSKRDIERLSPSTPSIRARALPDADIPALARLQQLRILDFSGGQAVTNASITDRGLAQLAALKLPQLETLTFGYSTNITDAGLVSIARMQSVKWLSLMVCQGITDAGLPLLLSMTNLTALDLRGCTASPTTACCIWRARPIGRLSCSVVARMFPPGRLRL